MFKFADALLNKITMYRLVVYVLVALLAAAFVLSFFGLLPFSPLALVFSTAIILAIALLANKAFAAVFEAPVNVESTYITSLILALIITPVPLSHIFSVSGLGFYLWAAVLATASKFILSFNKKHIFNPAALAVAITALTLGQTASWWSGTVAMLPFTLVGGWLVVKKISRIDLVAAFLLVAVPLSVIFAWAKGAPPVSAFWQILVGTPIIFFSSIMLTEPLTTPGTRDKRIAYGALVGLFFPPIIHLGSLYSTPELALVVGNLLSFLIGPKGRYVLRLKRKSRLAEWVYEFVFAADVPVIFLPGQYMEWTLPHEKPDDRGNRRYFTIASSPDEKEIKLGVKFYPESSSFKQAMFSLKENDRVLAAQPAGDFVLPKDKEKKLAFIAGGIGITPFHSILCHLLRSKEKRDVVLLYSAQSPQDLAYREMLDRARAELGAKVVYVATNADKTPPDWNGRKGLLTESAIREEIPDYLERTFYLSGPRSLVDGFRKSLRDLGVPAMQIKSDYFPGLV
ncbi:MAG: RnfABCDGE type electron transport complex subunit D [Patescibacteria group bacterium]|nr:RnfABCDGE type electron transport complex subunit D [Patescibacteria group bacterium]